MCVYNRMTYRYNVFFIECIYVYIYRLYINNVFNVYLFIYHTPFVYTQLSFSAAKHYSDKHIYISLWQLSFHQSSIEGAFFSFASEETPALLLGSAESTKTKGQYVNKTSELVAPKGKKKKDGKDEIQIEVTAKLGGIGVTVTSVEGDLTHAFIGGEVLFSCLLIQCCRKLRVVCVWVGSTTIISWCINEMLQIPHCHFTIFRGERVGQ